MQSKIKVIHVADKGFYELSLPSGHWIINGKYPFLNKEYVELPCTLNEEVKSIDKIVTTSKISHYEQDGSLISLDEYNKEYCRLTNSAVIDEDSSEVRFPDDDLDAEYEFKRFMRSTKAIVIKEDTQIPVDFVVHHTCLKHPSEFIESTYSLNGSEPSVCLVHVSRIQMDEFKKEAEIQGATVEIPNYSHLEFAKIDGKYVFTRNQRKMSNPNQVVRTSYENADTLEKVTREEIRQIVRAACVNLKSIGTARVADLTNRIDEIENLNNLLRMFPRRRLELSKQIGYQCVKMKEVLKESV